MRLCYSDTETYCDTPIKHGTYRYAQDAEVMVWAYALDDGETHVWDLTNGSEMPEDLAQALDDPECIFLFHNSMFDRTVLRLSMGIDIPTSRIHDTMVIALSHSLPGALATLCAVLGVSLEESKSGTGKDLIRLFCKPQPANTKIRRYTSDTHPKEWQEFLDYAKNDITAMRAIYRKMPRWNYRQSDMELWRLDQRINDRGFAVDTDLANAALEAIAHAQGELCAAAHYATGGDVGNTSQRNKLLGYILRTHGVDLPDLQKSTLERRIEDPYLPQEVKQLLHMRLDASKASTAKYKSLLNAVSPDSRLRGTIQFRGAARTGRDAGRVFQPQNLPRPTMKQDRIEDSIEMLKQGQYGQFITPSTMEVCSNVIRSVIVAPSGKKLCVSDLSNIEGRFAAWVAGEEWKLKAFRDFDNGIGEDLYKIEYARAFNVDPKTVNKEQRQIGKLNSLFLQYEGGVGAFMAGSLAYNIDLDDLAEKAGDTIPQWAWDEANRYYNFCVKMKQPTFDLKPKTFIVCDALKRMWRRSNPNITAMWKELKEAYISAVQTQGVNFPVRKLVLRRDGIWLRLRLLSGRVLCYPMPAAKMSRMVEEDTEEEEKFRLSYYGVNGYSRKWQKIFTYSGKLFENAVQAGSLDVFANAWQRAEDNGYNIVLRVHDELITEAPDDFFHSHEELGRIMSTPPKWAPDIPLAAGGFEALRYRKE